MCRQGRSVAGRWGALPLPPGRAGRRTTERLRRSGCGQPGGSLGGGIGSRGWSEIGLGHPAFAGSANGQLGDGQPGLPAQWRSRWLGLRRLGESAGAAKRRFRQVRVSQFAGRRPRFGRSIRRRHGNRHWRNRLSRAGFHWRADIGKLPVAQRRWRLRNHREQGSGRFGGGCLRAALAHRFTGALKFRLDWSAAEGRLRQRGRLLLRRLACRFGQRLLGWRGRRAGLRFGLSGGEVPGRDCRRRGRLRNSVRGGLSNHLKDRPCGHGSRGALGLSVLELTCLRRCWRIGLAAKSRFGQRSGVRRSRLACRFRWRLTCARLGRRWRWRVESGGRRRCGLGHLGLQRSRRRSFSHWREIVKRAWRSQCFVGKLLSRGRPGPTRVRGRNRAIAATDLPAISLSNFGLCRWRFAGGRGISRHCIGWLRAPGVAKAGLGQFDPGAIAARAPGLFRLVLLLRIAGREGIAFSSRVAPIMALPSRGGPVALPPLPGFTAL